MIRIDGLCANCGRAELEQRLVTRSFGSGERLMVIEGVPLLSCRHCGASYFEARKLHEIERLRRDAATTAAVRSVPVARFPGSAASTKLA